MQKDFDRWNKTKKVLDHSKKVIEFHEREIWWCSIGVNVGSEQHSRTGDFSRPVLVVRRLTKDMFWGVPLTTKIRGGKFRCGFVLKGIENEALVLQLRAWDRKRLVRKIDTIPKELYARIVDDVRGCLDAQK